MRLNRRVPNGTHGGVRGRGLFSPSYSIAESVSLRAEDVRRDKSAPHSTHASRSEKRERLIVPKWQRIRRDKTLPFTCNSCIICCGYWLNSANCQSARLVGVDPQIDPKRGYIVQALRFRADEGIGPYGTSFTLQVLILPILLTKADTHII